MKLPTRLLASLITLSLSLVVSIGSIGTQAQESTHEFPATSDTVVSIQNIHGTVKVHGWDQMKVKVVVVPHSAQVEAHFESPANRVHIHTHLLDENADTNARKVDYEVWAPANVRVDIELKSGTLEVENFSEDLGIRTVAATVALRNVSGHTSIETLNGNVEVHQCQGHVEATSISGSLHFTDCAAHFLKAGTTSGDIIFTGNLKFAGTYDFNNNEGAIELRLPPSASFDLTATAIQGSVQNEFPLKTRKNERTQQVDYQRSLTGTAQGGGARVKATTFSGTIRIQKQ